MTFPIDVNIPSTNNDPADDQPLIMQNFANINGYLQVDHTNPAALGAGQHEQVTFNNKNIPGIQTDPTSTLYTDSGSASSVSQLLYKNQNATLPVSAVRAFGVFAAPVATGAITALNEYNIASAAAGVAGSVTTYQITLIANVITGNNAVVLITLDTTTSATPQAYNYTLVGGVLTITTPTSHSLINFAILQF